MCSVAVETSYFKRKHIEAGFNVLSSVLGSGETGPIGSVMMTVCGAKILHFADRALTFSWN